MKPNVIIHGDGSVRTVDENGLEVEAYCGNLKVLHKVLHDIGNSNLKNTFYAVNFYFAVIHTDQDKTARDHSITQQDLIRIPTVQIKRFVKHIYKRNAKFNPLL